MKFLTPNLRFFLLICSIILASCNGKNDQRSQILVGKWFVEQASCNTRPTNMLEGTVFEFTPDGKMLTNIPQVGDGSYIFSDGKITQKANENIEYIVEELTPDKLEVKAEIRAMQFKIIFGRDSLIH